MRISTPAMLSRRSQAACTSSFVFERRALVTAGPVPQTRAHARYKAGPRVAPYTWDKCCSAFWSLLVRISISWCWFRNAITFHLLIQCVQSQLSVGKCNLTAPWCCVQSAGCYGRLPSPRRDQNTRPKGLLI